MIEYVYADPDEHWERELLAVVIRAGPSPAGFVTDHGQPLQLGVLHFPAGHEVPAHEHPDCLRAARQTQEVLFVRRGLLWADVYDRRRALVRRVELAAGDVILLAAGGHGFCAALDTEVVEAKVGPYLGERDKVRYGAV